MKPKRIILGLLCAGVVLGGGFSVQKTYADETQSVRTAKSQNEAEIVELQPSDVEISGDTITRLTSQAVAQKLINGGALVIPESLASKIGAAVFSRNSLQRLAGNDGEGISSVTAHGIQYVEQFSFTGNSIKTIDFPEATEVHQEAFSYNQIEAVHLPKVTEIHGIAFRSNKIASLDLPLVQFIDRRAFYNNYLTELTLPNCAYIDRAAFENNQIQKLNLPNAEIIREDAFKHNNIRSIDLPEAVKIGESAFAVNEIERLELPKIIEIGTNAFTDNKITSVDLPSDVAVQDDAFAKQFHTNNRHKSELADKTPIPFTDILSSQGISFKVGGVEQLTSDNINIDAPSVSADNDKKELLNPDKINPIDLEIQAPSIHYSIYSQISLTEEPSVTPPTTNPGGSNTTDPVKPTPPIAPTPTDPVEPEKPTTEVPNNAEKKGSTVHAIKGLYMYKTANFTKNQRIARYPKQKRINRPMFVITDYARSKGGALRYKVRDVNHKSKSAGKIGYITAHHKYVVQAYYQSVPKNKKITVIGTNGIHAYKNETLTRRAKSYKKGTHLRVKKIVKHNLTTRYQLSNGYYVTANKKLVIQGNY
ncbi:hypothetical protein FAM21834_01537 [Lentilactobacillus parabuchneri]|jgi:hypothetical protein|uniref:DUF5776 domain-containing protein n=3 Tax=Lentilactobacillus parabuchneri TaxID=152331 RepID=A0A1X1FEJ0_9LACO|nr:leucine-rich repeat protein [Lentilactobacillus parabuchneri]APR07655.1 hypothetical protein FAM21731_01478 [Lentilactobacillus parabuchneri]KRN72804.1 hypothetical protein IV42_GL001279 [Lentilactobacillus parabuchneri]MBW0222873.1 leucine-rich repeat protein [Lentilactobacillus parabuchneri]MBW0246025.1 leucine-rich repeat protein [Lentilactobacillus parabuchneri]MBW0264004.1 leucine-rich repeat protein [Lentilactobacillus parabuchneri]